MSNLNRRDWIKGVSAAGATMACGVRPINTANADQVQPDALTSLTLLHTNDLHGHLTAWRGWEGDLKDKILGGAACLATAIGRVRAEVGDRVLLLDAGDLIGDTMIADRTQGAALIEVFNQLGYDAMTLGNHEPDFGVETLRRRIADARFSFVAANLSEVDRDDPFVPPYVVKSVAGLRVGILGLTYPKTSKTTAPKNVSGLAFEEPVAAAVRYLPALGRETDLVIVLSHLGLDGDRRLATEVEGIDVIVGGHSHNRIATPLVINGTLILQAGAHGSDVGRLDLNVRNGGIESHRYELIPLDHAKLPPDEATERLVTDLCRPHRDALDEPIGTAADWLIRAQTLAGQEPRRRDEESPVDSLFADAIRQGLGVDFAFLPGVGYGVAIPPGPMIASQLRQLVPHDGTLVTMKLSGAEVREVLEQGLANVFSDDPREKVGGMIQVSGLRFRYRPASRRGERIVAVETEEGALNPTAEYRVATNAMLAAGGHNQRILAAGRDVNRHGSQFEFLKTWMSAHSPVRTPERGRTTKDV